MVFVLTLLLVFSPRILLLRCLLMFLHGTVMVSNLRYLESSVKTLMKEFVPMALLD